jgi:branched-chain amino acid transport system ATP-binding protein
MLLELDNVKTYYGNIRALKGISIQVAEGEIVCLIGGNGAGKSTTLMTISGVLTPVDGDVLYQGQSIVSVRPDNIVQMGICQVPEGRMIFPLLTVMENLDLGAYLRKDKNGIKEDFEKVFELFPVLRERSNQAGGTLSGGEQQMLAMPTPGCSCWTSHPWVWPQSLWTPSLKLSARSTNRARLFCL